MADFLMWGKVVEMGPGEFFAIMSAVPAQVTIAGTTARTKTMTTEDAAEEFIYATAVHLGALVHERGDRVVDVGSRLGGQRLEKSPTHRQVGANQRDNGR